MKFSFIILLLFSLKSCGDKATTEMLNKVNEQLSGNYIIAMFDDKNVSDYKLNIDFDNGNKHVSGFSGCNRFSGSYTLEANHISFGPLAVTRMACMGKANTLETHFLKLLKEVNAFSFENNELKLFNGDNLLITAIQNNAYHVEYTAHSRGFFHEITVSDGMISVQKNQASKVITKPCSTAELDKLNNLLKDIDITSLSKLEPPTKAHQYDGAPIVNLKVTYQGKDFQTQSFDHGNPPKEIEALVKEILSLSQKIE